MKVQLTKVVLDKEVDVTLPLYRKQDLRGDDGMGTVIFMRVDQPGPLLREVSIAITAKVHDKNNNDSVMFIIEIEHAAVFLMKHIPAEHHERVLAVDCPLMLFPFTRQIVCQAAVDGGFMPFLMEPINFIALYDNAQQKEQEN